MYDFIKSTKVIHRKIIIRDFYFGYHFEEAKNCHISKRIKS
ncbi:hypothetical protein LEP1GSC120_3518 [Leptospira santarosai str. 200702252]|nr:hypothetical protein LEP1GSC130_2749 [Leptospira santarosai str. 200403458]EMO98222.1 hypothetical protein LEP1GSC120_3518 [Leptospira santarosai str. 200702252]